jgi:diguanylate cyclase (GGDEF)-like protein
VRRVTTIVVPEGLLVLGAAAAVRWPAVLAPVRAGLPLLAAIVGVAGAVLAIRFRRLGVLLGLLALTAAGGASYAAGPEPGLQAAAAVLLPLNLLVFALLPERGLAGAAAGRRAAALAAQILALLVLVRTGQQGLLEPLARRALTARILPPSVAVGDLAALAAAAAITVLAVRLVLTPDPMARGFLWAVGAGLLAFIVSPERDVGGLSGQTVLLAAAGLSLVVALIESAHAAAYVDPLTGLPNRRALDEALRRLDGPFAVAMADVDRFKAVNDTHGHEVGDQVLRLVATRLADVGEGGRPFRYGGEEFAILFAGRAAPDILPALETVRAAVEAASFTLRAANRPRRRPKRPRRPSGARKLAVTISLGVAHRRPDDATAGAVVERADDALYRAKDRGRNRVESGEPARRA